MKHADFAALVRNTIGDLVQKPGDLLFSHPSTIQSGSLYLLGTNPGGESSISIAAKLNELAARRPGWSAYNTGSPFGVDWCPRIWRRYQNGVTGMLRVLAIENATTPDKVCASNLVFVRTRKGTDLHGLSKDTPHNTWLGLADACWKLHEEILRCVRPKALIAYGCDLSKPSAYRYFANQAVRTLEDSPKFSAKNYVCRALEFRLFDQPIVVVGIPHFSRVQVHRFPDAIRWMRAILKRYGAPVGAEPSA